MTWWRRSLGPVTKSGQEQAGRIGSTLTRPPGAARPRSSEESPDLGVLSLQVLEDHLDELLDLPGRPELRQDGQGHRPLAVGRRPVGPVLSEVAPPPDRGSKGTYARLGARLARDAPEATGGRRP